MVWARRADGTWGNVDSTTSTSTAPVEDEDLHSTPAPPPPIENTPSAFPGVQLKKVVNSPIRLEIPPAVPLSAPSPVSPVQAPPSSAVESWRAKEKQSREEATPSHGAVGATAGIFGPKVSAKPPPPFSSSTLVSTKPILSQINTTSTASVSAGITSPTKTSPTPGRKSSLLPRQSPPQPPPKPLKPSLLSPSPVSSLTPSTGFKTQLPIAVFPVSGGSQRGVKPSEVVGRQRTGEEEKKWRSDLAPSLTPTGKELEQGTGGGGRDERDGKENVEASKVEVAEEEAKEVPLPPWQVELKLRSTKGVAGKRFEGVGVGMDKVLSPSRPAASSSSSRLSTTAITAPPDTLPSETPAPPKPPLSTRPSHNSNPAPSPSSPLDLTASTPRAALKPLQEPSPLSDLSSTQEVHFLPVSISKTRRRAPPPPRPKPARLASAKSIQSSCSSVVSPSLSIQSGSTYFSSEDEEGEGDRAEEVRRRILEGLGGGGSGGEREEEEVEEEVDRINLDFEDTDSEEEEAPATGTVTPTATGAAANLPPPTPTTSAYVSHAPPPRRANAGSHHAAKADRAAPSEWSKDKTGFAKEKAIEFARNRRDVLNPPPGCFSRPVPPKVEGEGAVGTTYRKLEKSIVLRSEHSNDLARAYSTGRAWPMMPPTMTSHDVHQVDWRTLWEDIDETARIELRAHAGLKAATLPLIPLFGAGLVVSQVAQRALRAQRVGPTCKVVEAWNEKFFNPRHLDVYIAQGTRRLSGPYKHLGNSDPRLDLDPALIQSENAETEAERQRARKVYQKYENKFRFVVRSLEGDTRFG